MARTVERVQGKKILAIADTHCGHLTGLTTPKYQSSAETKWGRSQREAWTWTKQKILENGPYSVVFFLGDAIAGKNPKWGATQLLTADRNSQVKMSLEVFKMIGCKKIFVCAGTPYHVGRDGEDWEATLCNRLNDQGYRAEFGAQHFISVNGKIFDLRHKMGGSARENLRGTPLLNQALFNTQWYIRGIQPLADCIIRGHVHWEEMIQMDHKWLIAVPALNTLGDKFGSRMCDGTVSFGFCVIKVESDGTIIPKMITEVLGSQPEVVVKL